MQPSVIRHFLHFFFLKLFTHSKIEETISQLRFIRNKDLVYVHCAVEFMYVCIAGTYLEFRIGATSVSLQVLVAILYPSILNQLRRSKPNICHPAFMLESSQLLQTELDQSKFTY